MRTSKKAYAIWKEFRKGKPPSKIDEELCLTKGTARYEIACIWARDKEESNGVQESPR